MTQWRHLFSLEIFLESGYFVLNGLKTSTGTYGKEVLTVAKNRTTAPAATFDSEERFEFDIDNSWKIEMNNFIDAVLHKKINYESGITEAKKVMRIIDEIYKKEKLTVKNLNTTLK